MVASVNDSYKLVNKPSVVLGVLKWCYFVSPVAYFCDYEYHKKAVRLTKELWRGS